MSTHPSTIRQIKYGTNVAVSLVAAVVILLASVYLVQQRPMRADMTAGGDFSLSPRTKAILSGLEQPMRIVSLYGRERQEGDTADYHARVADLLREYQRYGGGKVTIDLIDPRLEVNKLDDLIKQVAARESTEVDEYKAVVDAFEKEVRPAVEQLAKEQTGLLGKLPLEEIKDQNVQQTLTLAVVTVSAFPEQLEKAKARIDRRLGEKIPNYQGAVTELRANLDSLSALLGGVVDGLKQAGGEGGSGGGGGGVPDDVVAYSKTAGPLYEQVKKQVDALLEKARGLGELKLDTLRQSLRGRSILVMSEGGGEGGRGGWKVLPFGQIWQTGERLRSVGTPGENTKLTFAGEQQISAAVVAMSGKTKPLAVIVRPEGPPLASAFFGRNAPLSDMADRLREMNFDVKEKDLSGQWAMQAQMQGMPAEEPEDAELERAVWIVLAYQPGGGGMGGMGADGGGQLAMKLKRHLDGGGSALVLGTLEGDALASALEPWGITLEPNRVIVHEGSPDNTPNPGSSDPVADAQRLPFVMLTTDYGQHVLARPIAALEGLLVPLVPVRYKQTAGVEAAALLPISAGIKTWAESDVNGVMETARVSFDEASGDVLNTPDTPLAGGVAAERKMAADGGGSGEGSKTSRLVVLGNLSFATASFLNMPDMQMARRGVLAPRLPGNAELLGNSMLWLSGQDTVLAVSPVAAEVRRIGPMSEQTRGAVGLGVLGLGLPLAVVALGLGVWWSRRS